MEIIGYIAFETTSMKTFIIHVVILLFSLGALTVLMTPEDEENNHNEKKQNENINNFSNIVVIDTLEEVKELKEIQVKTSQETEFVKEEIIEVPIQTPIVSFTEECSLSSSPPPLTSSISIQSVQSNSTYSFTEPEPTTNNNSVEINESVKATPKRKVYKQREVSPPSSPPMSPTRRSDRKIKKPEYFDPGRKR